MRLAQCTVHAQTVTTSRASPHDDFMYARIPRSIAGNSIQASSTHCGASCKTCRSTIGCATTPNLAKTRVTTALPGGLDDDQNFRHVYALLRVVIQPDEGVGRRRLPRPSDSNRGACAAVCSHLFAVQPAHRPPNSSNRPSLTAMEAIWQHVALHAAEIDIQRSVYQPVGRNNALRH